MAAVPTTTPFTVVNGTATWNGSGTLGTLNASDRAIVSWGQGNFTIAAGDTFSFILPSGGSVLNKVGYGVSGSNTSVTDVATINGTITSTGRVFVLANGDISVGGGSVINTANGLFLSTLRETDNFTFATSGNLALTGTPDGNITLGSGATQLSIAGNLSAWGNTITTNNISVSGDFLVNQRGAGATLNVTGSGGNTSVGGNFTATSNNGPIGQGTTALIVGNTTTLATNGNAAVTLASAANNFNTVVANVGTGTGGNVTLTDANSIIIGAGRVGETLTVTAAGDITTNGTLTVGANASLTSNTAGNITFANSSTVGNTISANAVGGNVAISTIGNLTTNLIASSAASTANVTTTGTLNITGSVGAGSNGVNFVGANINSNSTGNIQSAGVVNLNATAGGVVLPIINAARVNVVATGGSISQSASTNLTTTGLTSTFDAGTTGNITLTSVTNSFNGGILQLTGRDVSITSTSNLVLGSTNTTGNLNVTTLGTNTAGLVTIGNGFGTAAQALTVGGSMNITTNNSAVSDDTYSSQTVFGAVTINTIASGGVGGAVTLNAAASNPAGTSRTQYGQFNVNAGTAAVTLTETNTVNLGNVIGGSGTIRSTGGDILINGNTTIGAVTFNASAGSITQGAGGSVNLTSTSTFNSSNSGGVNLSSSINQFGGVVTLINGGNVNVVSGSSISFNPGNVTSGNVTVTSVNSGNTVTLSGGNMTNVTINSAGKAVINGGTIRNLTITAGDTSATSITQSGGGFSLNGTLTLTSAGGINIGNNTTTAGLANITGNVVLANVTGDSYISSSRGITVSGTSSGNVTLVAGQSNSSTTTGFGSFAGPWGIVFGNLNVRNLTASASNGFFGNSVAGTSGTISQASGSSLHVEEVADFVTVNNNIVLGNNGNSLGRVSFYTNGTASLGNISAATINLSTGNGSVTYVEDGTARIGNVSTAGGVSLMSRFGSVVEDTAQANLTVNGTLTVAAPAGSIMLGNATGNTVGSNIVSANLSASGSASLYTLGNLTLGETNANSLTVISGDTLTQSAPLNIFGTSSFQAANGISLTNPANNFGPVSLNVTVVNKNLAITEGNTLNLRAVTMPGTGNGTFTAASVNGDIIDSGFGGVKLGGNVVNNNAVFGTGVVSLAATNGNIVIDDATSDVLTSGGLVFNANNVTLSVLGTPGSTVVLGSSTAGSSALGNLSVSSIQGNIGSAGSFSVGGSATFQATAGNITLGQSGTVGFGALRFIGNQVSINEGGNMDILTGSSAFGSAALISGGSISIIDAGGGTNVTFGNSVSMSATGNIVLKLTQAVGQLAVSASGTKDLSALSLSTDLNSKNPIYGGTGPDGSTVPALAPKP